MEQPETKRNPDVLECLANLSNDEVFTPPRVANAMLDLLPQALFRDPTTTFLDPCSKSGVFLREIAKRLIVGLEPVYPDLQERLDHIFHNQLFGFAITELTALTSRRSVYCTKFADGDYAISHFDTPEGNILLPPAKHVWVDGKCRLCGASKEILKDRAESHAYAFIHGINPEKVFHMKFDVIIGNPPYQLQDGGGGLGSSAKPLYQNFVETAQRLKPGHLVFVIPARWYSGGKGLDEFRKNMLEESHLRVLVDYFDSTECFPGVDISGGVCFFDWDKAYNGNCLIVNHIKGKKDAVERPLLLANTTTLIRFNAAVSIIKKIQAQKAQSFMQCVSSSKPFGFRSYVFGHTPKGKDDIALYTSKNATQGVCYVRRDEILVHPDWVDKWKVYISKAYGERDAFPYWVLGKPFIGEPQSCCTETYLVLGVYETEQEARNVCSYVRTKFFRFLVLMKKNTQNSSMQSYEFVPMQDFSKAWTDAELYKKYGLTDEEIAFIESMVKPMEV